MTSLRIVPDHGVDRVFHLMDAVSLVAIAAISTGLPAPAQVYIDDHVIQISLGSEDDLNTWATWLRAEVDVYQVEGQVEGEVKAIRYRSARAERFAAPVVVAFTEEVD